MGEAEGVVQRCRARSEHHGRGANYGPCRGGNSQPTWRTYTTSHRDFKSPAVFAKIGLALERSPKSGTTAPFSLPLEHFGPLPRGLERRDRCGRLPHALEQLVHRSLRGWGGRKRASKLLCEVLMEVGGAGAQAFGAGGGVRARVGPQVPAAALCSRPTWPRSCLVAGEPARARIGGVMRPSSACEATTRSCPPREQACPAAAPRAAQSQRDPIAPSCSPSARHLRAQWRLP
eukprot:scaffold53485_cov63-Phaeocystis_antarctica.AAC.1